MPHAPRLKLKPDTIAEMALKYHVDQIQFSKQDGVTRVHHIQWGWMPVERYYGLAKLHDAIPIVEKVIEGGYRLKAALWNIDVSFSVIGSGTEVPLGLAFVSGALLLSAIDQAAGRTDLAILDVASLFLPYGELYLIYRGIVSIPGVSDLAGVQPPQGEPGSIEYKMSALQSLQDIARAALKGLGWFPF